MREALVSAGGLSRVREIARPTQREDSAKKHARLLLDALASIETLTDVDLSLELVAIDQKIETIRADLQAVARGDDHFDAPPPGWHHRAERALAHAKTRRKLLSGETQRRLKVAKQTEVSAGARLHADTIVEVARLRTDRQLAIHSG